MFHLFSVFSVLLRNNRQKDGKPQRHRGHGANHGSSVLRVLRVSVVYRDYPYWATTLMT